MNQDIRSVCCYIIGINQKTQFVNTCCIFKLDLLSFFGRSTVIKKMYFMWFNQYLYTDIEILEVEVQEYQCIRRMKIINGVLGICKDVRKKKQDHSIR